MMRFSTQTYFCDIRPMLYHLSKNYNNNKHHWRLGEVYACVNYGTYRHKHSQLVYLMITFYLFVQSL